MDQTRYQQWWQLHLRQVRGETLSAAERALYETGLTALDREEAQEWATRPLDQLRQLKAEVERLEVATAHLQSQRQQLDQQIWMLEGAYMTLTGHSLTA